LQQHPSLQPDALADDKAATTAAKRQAQEEFEKLEKELAQLKAEKKKLSK
jgi:hypothetical protein